MRLIIRYVLVAVMLFTITPDTEAQLGKDYQEVWPAVDVYYRISPKVRMYGTIAGTKKESSYSDGAVGVFVDYFTRPFASIIRLNHADSLPGRMFWVRAGYQYSSTPQSSEDPFKENMFVAEANGRLLLPYNLLLTLKNRFDGRFNSGNFNVRYRPRLLLEKDLKTDYLFFTLSAMAEYYANFGNSSINRLRTQLGVEIRVTRKINYEVFWSHQYENAPEIPSVDAFGMTIKFYLQKKNKKQNKNSVKQQS